MFDREKQSESAPRETTTTRSKTGTPTVPGEMVPGEIIIGELQQIDNNGQPLVTYRGSPGEGPLAALSTVSLAQKHIGRQLALLFAEGDPLKPVIMGLIHSPLNDLLDTLEEKKQVRTAGHKDVDSQKSQNGANQECYMDGQKIVLEGKEEIVLKCGESSITLTRSGKILIRGNYLLNRSTGVNRIMGTSVQLN